MSRHEKTLKKKRPLVRDRVITVKDRVMNLLNTIYLGEETYSRVSHKLINAVKVFIVSSRKFILDDCFTRASSITYTIILSLIPALTVALTFYYRGDKEEIFRRITLFLAENSIMLDVAPIFAVISGLIDNAAKIGGISAAVMVFSATAMLRSMEKSFNVIWRIKKGRKIFLTVIYYWAALTLGPVMLITGTTVAAQLSERLSTAGHLPGLLVTAINFLGPFVFIWLLFFMAYITLPNTRVSVKPAALGAAFTGALWVVFILLFIVYVRSFARSTTAIYGALAAIPLFLIMVYASSLIVLYGAEVAYTLMFPELYHNLKKSLSEREGPHPYYSVALLHQIYKKFEDGKGPTTYRELLKMSALKAEEIDRHLENYLGQKLIVQNNGEIYPATNSKNIRIIDVMEPILHIYLAMPLPVGKSTFRSQMYRLFANMTKSRKRTVGAMTLGDLMDYD